MITAHNLPFLLNTRTSRSDQSDKEERQTCQMPIEQGPNCLRAVPAWILQFLKEIWINIQEVKEHEEGVPRAWFIVRCCTVDEKSRAKPMQHSYVICVRPTSLANSSNLSDSRKGRPRCITCDVMKFWRSNFHSFQTRKGSRLKWTRSCAQQKAIAATVP